MTIDLTETASYDPIPVPEGGDPVSRAGLVAAYQAIADRLAFLEERLGWPARTRSIVFPALSFLALDGTVTHDRDVGATGYDGSRLTLAPGAMAELPLSPVVPENVGHDSLRIRGTFGASGDELLVERVVYDPDAGYPSGAHKVALLTLVDAGAFAFDDTWSHGFGPYDVAPNWWESSRVFAAERGTTTIRLTANGANASDVQVYGATLDFYLTD